MLANRFRDVLDCYVPGPSDTYIFNLWKRLKSGGVLSERVSSGYIAELPVEDMAAAIVCRLATDELADAVDRTRALAAQTCVSPRFIRPGEDPVGIVENIPEEWRHVRALEPGHTLQALVAALLLDGMHGYQDHGAGLFEHLSITSYEPGGVTTLGLSETGRDAVADGGDLAERLTTFAPVARYGEPAVLFGSVRAHLDHLRSASRPRRSGVNVSRSISLSQLWLMASAIADHERGSSHG